MHQNKSFASAAAPGLLRRRALMALAAAAVLPAALALTETRTVPARVRVAVGNKDCFMFRHLPLDIAQQLNFFAPEGVRVTLQNHTSDAAALHAMHEGHADVCAVNFEQLLRAPAAIEAGARCFVLQGRAPQAALGVSLRHLPHFKTLADLEHRAIGVCTLGSLSHTVACLALEQAGVPLHRVSFVAVGGGKSAWAALRTGRVQALCQGDPLMTRLEQQGDVRIVTDTRLLSGTKTLFGGPMPGSCLVAPAAMLTERAPAVQAVTHGVVRALKWLQTAAPADIVQVLPKAKTGTERSITLAAFAHVRETFSPDGSMPADGPATALRALKVANPVVAVAWKEPEVAVLNGFALRAKLKYSA